MQPFSKRKFLLAAAAVFALAAAEVPAQKPDPGMGAWNLNLQKSRFSPGPAPKSLVAKWEPSGNGVKVTTESVNADGSKGATEYVAAYDGKDVPLKGSPNADTVSLVRKDPLTTVRTDKKGGQQVLTYTRVIARDGKSFTVAVKGKNPKGEPVDNMLWFDKQ